MIEGVGHAAFSSDNDCIELGADRITATGLFDLIGAEVLPGATSTAFQYGSIQEWSSIRCGYQLETKRIVPKVYRMRISIALIEELTSEECERYWEKRCKERVGESG